MIIWIIFICRMWTVPKPSIPVLRTVQIYKEVFQDNRSKYASFFYWTSYCPRIILRPNVMPNEIKPTTPTHGFMITTDYCDPVTDVIICHIMFTGVVKEQRGRGIFCDMLLELASTTPRSKISMCINPQKYPVMFKIAKNYGFKLKRRFKEHKLYFEVDTTTLIKKFDNRNIKPLTHLIYD